MNQGSKPVLEEFIPPKNTNSSNNENEEISNVSSDKANWMTSAQLWNQESTDVTKAPQSPLMASNSQEADIELALNGTENNEYSGGTFHPFSSKNRDAFPELALASAHKEEMADKKSSSETNSRRENSGKGGSDGGAEKEQISGTMNTNQSTSRKTRRCWSPDLHRRFVNAVHLLGGSHEIQTSQPMPTSSSHGGSTSSSPRWHMGPTRMLCLRRRPLYGAHPAAGAATHHVPPSFWRSPAPQEMYSAIAPQPPPPNHQMHHHAIHHHHHHHHHQQQVHHKYNKPPLTQRNGSPELDVHGGAGDPSESIEEGNRKWELEGGQRRQKRWRDKKGRRGREQCEYC